MFCAGVSSNSCKRQSKKQQNKKLTHARIQDGGAVFTPLYTQAA